MKALFILWGISVCFIVHFANANNLSLFNLFDSEGGGGYYGRGFGPVFGGGHK